MYILGQKYVSIGKFLFNGLKKKYIIMTQSYEKKNNKNLSINHVSFSIAGVVFSFKFDVFSMNAS